MKKKKKKDFGCSLTAISLIVLTFNGLIPYSMDIKLGVTLVAFFTNIIGIGLLFMESDRDLIMLRLTIKDLYNENEVLKKLLKEK